MIGGTVSFLNTPETVVCRKSISKAGHLYFVFLPAEGYQYLKTYLELRMKTKVHNRKTHSHGKERIGILEEVRVPREKLTPESPLIGVMNNEKSAYVTTTSLCYDIKQAIVAAEFGWRPYVLRRYFEICMMNAEYDKLILREWREFWMGQVGNIESVYSVNKGLPREVVEKMPLLLRALPSGLPPAKPPLDLDPDAFCSLTPFVVASFDSERGAQQLGQNILSSSTSRSHS